VRTLPGHPGAAGLKATTVHDHLPLIVVEIVMVFGGALAFAWWQLRDLDREKRKRQQAQAQQRAADTERLQARGLAAASERSAAEVNGHAT
jgi:choline-glycine betaine transporter